MPEPERGVWGVCVGVGGSLCRVEVVSNSRGLMGARADEPRKPYLLTG